MQFCVKLYHKVHTDYGRVAYFISLQNNIRLPTENIIRSLANVIHAVGSTPTSDRSDKKLQQNAYLQRYLAVISIWSEKLHYVGR
jgi:hypothetical protein